MPASILVIDDNADNVALVDHVLRAQGYEPLLARSGPEGIRIALEQRPDVILLDIRMPEMTGYEVAATLREHAELAHATVIALTAYAMVGDRERIAEAGFDGYIQKPIEAESFVALVESFMRGEPGPGAAAATER